ncbi:hypothetical protein [Tenacibaculum sp. 1_MG-2023]|uniref:hypothetical protein n=1 Tax=Tenacibaculum sp. 1_MG-2023 TaxID=3062653 RepID=UPI0026E26A00|nr:hypothetical protein [Tenacibaculum sp. 1_MG-2023]MDO6600225.1 hypothetical protein [Tenacibaculum sp. 1_MG-2023]
MKTILKLTLLFTFFLTLFNCDNDNGNAPNQNICNYEGLTFLDSSNNTQTILPETQLQTDFFPNNGGPGIAAVEIYETSNPGNIWFITDVVTLNGTGTGTLGIGNTNYTVNVTCQRAGTMIGEEFRFDIVTTNGSEGELCVVIDNVTP